MSHSVRAVADAQAPLRGAREGPKRLIGLFGGYAPGPTLVCVGGLHGNEPAGVLALRRLLARLEDSHPPFRGELLALAGNLEALRLGRRFVDRDLNRAWTRRQIARARSASRPGTEDREQLELMAVMADTLDRNGDEIYVVDLHTTSADSAPFVTLGDTLHNRAFARRIGLPLVLGIEEQIEGALLEFVNERGPVTLGIEAGQHEDPASIDNHERALWMALMASGNVRERDVPWVRAMRRELRQAYGALPGVFEVRYRRGVNETDGFRMRPGYRNLQPVLEGEILATDRDGPVRAPEAGRVFLPLYQELGDDGFFIVREISAAWLRVSSVLRRLRMDAIAHWLPGIHRARRRPETLIVDRRVARWLAIELLHLLGFRKKRVARGAFVFSRRPHDRLPRRGHRR